VQPAKRKVSGQLKDGFGLDAAAVDEHLVQGRSGRRANAGLRKDIVVVVVVHGEERFVHCLYCIDECFDMSSSISFYGHSLEQNVVKIRELNSEVAESLCSLV
jgi:hypothetical protein